MTLEHEKYIEERVMSQQKWFGDKSSENKNIYYILSIATIILSVCVPIFVKINWSTISIISSSLCTILISTNFILKPKDKWIIYRSTSEKLKKEYAMFMANNDESKFLEFMNKVESIIEESNNKWEIATEKQDKK